MSTPTALHGMNCPRCGGVLQIPEGQLIICCPYCDLRSYIKGERGLLRYQTARRVEEQQAISAMHKFLVSNLAIARDASTKAQVSEAFLAYMPFWTVWGRAVAWIFGEKQVGSGNNKRYEPREVRLMEDVSWNGAACDAGELGVIQVPLHLHDFDPYNPEALHAQGLVFEPVGSFAEASREAEADFEKRIRGKAKLDRISQAFIRFLRKRHALVYYPLWVLRYLYRGRAFQVVVDGVSGQVLYGKAPGNTFYRAAALVLGMAAGAFIAIDVSTILLYLVSDDSDGILALLAISFLGGLGLMFWAYRAFRYGEEYEYRPGSGNMVEDLLKPKKLEARVEDLEKWINQLN
jgi:hypothetical protein